MVKDPYIQYLLSKVKPRVPLTKEQLDKARSMNDPWTTVSEVRDDSELDDEIKRYLGCVVKNPDLNTTSYTKMMGLTTYMADRIRKEILKQKLAIEFATNCGRKHGGIIKITELTEKGYACLNRKLPARIKGDGSPEHRWWQRRLYNHFNSLIGIKAEIEMHRNSKSADVGVSVLNSKIIAVEVELSDSNAIRNIKADIEAGFSSVIVGCNNRSVQKSVRHSFEMFLSEHKNFPKDRVEIRLLPEILDSISF
jgi:hypothetical protein